MSKADIKCKAWNLILGGIADRILSCEEDKGWDREVIEEMRKQAKRIMKFLGFESYPGI